MRKPIDPVEYTRVPNDGSRSPHEPRGPLRTDPEWLKKPRPTFRESAKVEQPYMADLSGIAEARDAARGEAEWAKHDRRITRRRLLVGGGALAAAGVVSPAIKRRYNASETVALADSLAGDERKWEMLPDGALRPEEEREGRVFLTGSMPSWSPLPIIGGYDFATDLRENLGGGFSTLPKGCEVKILVPDGSSDDCMNVAEGSFPHLNFTPYELPVARAGYVYPQDIFMASGSADDGRLIVAADAYAGQRYKLFRRMQELGGDGAGLNPSERYMQSAGLMARLRNFVANEEVEARAEVGMRLFAGEILAQRNPTDFDLRFVPVATEGGDLLPTRLPDGSVGLIVGQRNLATSMLSLIFEDRDLKEFKTPEDLRKCFKIDSGRFATLYAQVLGRYETYFGVNRVIVPDHDGLMDMVVAGAKMDLQRLANPAGFFHVGMLVKTTSTLNGEAVAYVSQLSTGSKAEYPERVAAQFAKWGYTVRRLPCVHPVQNYTTAVARSGGTVSLPQYGHAQTDRYAREALKRDGFEVRRADMEYVSRFPKEVLDAGGSLSCRISNMA